MQYSEVQSAVNAVNRILKDTDFHFDTSVMTVDKSQMVWPDVNSKNYLIVLKGEKLPEATIQRLMDRLEMHSIDVSNVCIMNGE